MKNLVLLIIFIGTMAGCASTYSIKPETINELEYGQERTKVIEQLETEGLPLFRFRAGNKEHYSEVYEPEDSFQQYIFLYSGEQLESVVKVQEGLLTWEEQVGKYGRSVPNILQLGVMATSIKELGLNLQQTNFGEINVEKQKEHRDTIIHGVAANLVMPLGLMAFVYTAPVSIPMMTIMHNKDLERKAAFVSKLHQVPLGTTEQQVIDLLGQPIKRADYLEESILVFDSYNEEHLIGNRASAGFVEGRMLWMGYYYDAVGALERMSEENSSETSPDKGS